MAHRRELVNNKGKFIFIPTIKCPRCTKCNRLSDYMVYHYRRCTRCGAKLDRKEYFIETMKNKLGVK